MAAFRRPENSKTQVTRYDRYRLSVPEILIALAKGGAACGILAYTFYRSFQAFLVMLPIGLFYPVYERKRLEKKRLRELADQFKEAMVVLASSLNAGFSVENALVVSREELLLLYGEEGMIVKEFSYMIQQIRMNQPVERVLGDFADRTGLEDIRSLSEVFSVAKRNGGDLGGIMRRTAEVIRDKMQIREEIRTMTASKQFEQKIMNLIPFFIVFYVELSSPGFFDQMYGTMMGRMLMSVCLAVYLISLWLAQRILDIEV